VQIIKQSILMKTRLFVSLCVAAVAVSCTGNSESVTTFSPTVITVDAPLSARLERNLSRLQDSLYLPPVVYEDKDWPGDFVGRTILGLTMDSEALHTQTPLLEDILNGLLFQFNVNGYLGPIYDPVINEQTLSGHGWLLRGLCQYYKWTSNEKVMPIIRSVAENLFVAGKGRYAEYPISKETRTTDGGQASGSIAGQAENWMLSTDIGCVFIGMAGLIDAYELIPEPQIKETIDEMIARFLEVDLAGIKAQTHATLSALRGLIKYAGITGDTTLLDAVRERWDLYVSQGMTCTYANYNWFGRPDSWTEPCAIVDSYIVAFDLWKLTLDPSYRDIAELIYSNAICRAQRANGGFGCESCPSSEDPFLKVIIPEAHWCCTMRGAEGLSRAAEYSWARKGKKLFVPFYRSGSLKTAGLEIAQQTNYPDDGSVTFCFAGNEPGINALMLPSLPWTENVKVLLNGTEVVPVVVDGFLCIKHKFAEGDKVEVSFDMPVRSDEWNGSVRYFKGPQMLGLRTLEPVDDVRGQSLRTVSNLMDPETEVLQVLF